MRGSEIRKWRDFEKKIDADERKWKEFENYAWNVFKGSRWNGNDRKKEIWESYIRHPERAYNRQNRFAMAREFANMYLSFHNMTADTTDYSSIQLRSNLQQINIETGTRPNLAPSYNNASYISTLEAVEKTAARNKSKQPDKEPKVNPNKLCTIL